MDKSTLATIIVCVVLISVLFAVRACNAADQTLTTDDVVTTLDVEAYVKMPYKAVDNGEKATVFKYETDYFNITFDTEGASIKSMMLKNHANADGQYVDIVFKGESDNNAFLLYWEDDTEHPVKDAFNYEIAGKKVIFRKTFQKDDGSEFVLVKTFEFRDGEYLFAVNVDFEGSQPNGGSYAYTIAYEPEVGPSFTNISNNNYDYRRFYLGLKNNNGKVKRSSAKLASNNEFYVTRDLKWFSLTSKYFTVIAVPENETLRYKYTAKRSSGDISQTDGLYVSVPTGTKDARIYYYCGPQLRNYLGSYYSGTDNAWGLKNLNLENAMESGSILGWLETVLKWCLTMLHKIVPNFGIDIIILTIILKLVLWPLNKKGTDSTAKINMIQPQVQEIQAKYSDNPQKQNMELSALYKEYGIKPLGGCLPLLIQFPILIAFYGLLNKHFELRGAMFIPGWIPDLSVPDIIAVLNFRIPLLGNEIHLLPILYEASMIFSMKITQAQQPKNSEKNGTMWFMTYGMPIIFFFILYSAPSGLLLYWSTQNVLSIFQQISTNRKLKSGKIELKKVDSSENKQPAAIIKYQEKLKKLEEAKAAAEKQNAKNKKKGK